ncbi:MAG TPA: hypothetical protein VNK67_00465 [Burkholderiales bacterium]|nr:hypothetical protein [Burkholderiales bacterium]
MRLAFIVCNEYLAPRLMQLLAAAGIDYYTRWDGALGKGRGTEPHLGRGGYGATNSVVMIAFEEDAPLEALARTIAAENEATRRADDRIRLFQLPLERVL